jgi:hypothetical protein
MTVLWILSPFGCAIGLGLDASDRAFLLQRYVILAYSKPQNYEPQNSRLLVVIGRYRQ